MMPRVLPSWSRSVTGRKRESSREDAERPLPGRTSMSVSGANSPVQAVTELRRLTAGLSMPDSRGERALPGEVS